MRPAAQRVLAQQSSWQITSFTDAVLQLYATPDDALYARTTDGLVRSSDAGTTWGAVDLPPLVYRAGVFRNYLAFDQAYPDVLYARGDAGVFKRDGAQSAWQLVLPIDVNSFVESIATGPAGSHRVYAALGSGPLRFYPSGTAPALTLLTSTDDGATWQQVWQESQAGQPMTCPVSVTLLQAHPQEVGRLFGFWACGQGAAISATQYLGDSRDDGRTWAMIGGWYSVWPSLLAGGSPAAPQRFYLAADVPAESPGSILVRSDDDAQTWQEVGEDLLHTAPDVGHRPTVSGLVVDPVHPDILYVSLAHSGDGVWQSSDGGHTWQDLGLEGVGHITDLARGADGQHLYAATDQGIWQLPLSSSSLDGSDGAPPL